MRLKPLFLRLFAAVLAAALLCSPAAALDPEAECCEQGIHIASDPTMTENRDVFVPLRDFMDSLGVWYRVDWNAARRTAYVSAPGLSITVKVGQAYLVANERYLYLEGESFLLNGRLMVSLRPLARACGLETEWNEEESQPELVGEYRPIQDGASFYDEEELYWLSRIIYAEAGIEELEGMIAVGNVVLNRVEREYWPDNVHDVVFDQRFGVTQFTPVSSGTIYQEPSRQAEIAAKIALEGVKLAGDSLYFVNESVANGSWFHRNCTYVTTIGRHCFYTQDIA